MAYDVFISYRRETGGSDARLLQQALENAKRGYKVFFDYTSIRDGKFNDEIFDAIDFASVFILMVTRGVFDRCAEDGDWVRIELERAIDRGKKIVPVAPSDQTWCMPGNLPDKLEEIKTQYDLHDKFKENKGRLHSIPTQIQSEYVNPFIPNGINRNLMRQVNDFAMSGVLASFEMSPNGFKLIFK